METITEMIDQGWRVYVEPPKMKNTKNLKIIKLYRYPNLIFVKNKQKIKE